MLVCCSAEHSSPTVLCVAGRLRKLLAHCCCCCTHCSMSLAGISSITNIIKSYEVCVFVWCLGGGLVGQGPKGCTGLVAALLGGCTLHS